MHAYSDFGPWPAEPVDEDEDVYAAEFELQFQRERDPRYSQYCDDVLNAAESQDWYRGSQTLEDMWKHELEPDAWLYGKVIQSCLQANETDSLAVAEALLNESRGWSHSSSLERFQLFPNCKWTRQLKAAGCSIQNSLDWKGRHPLPSADRPVWLLPAQDDAAEQLAEHEVELCQNGWKVLTCNQDVVAELRSKTALPELARRANVTSYMPAHYPTPAEAVYPCMLKASRATWGKSIYIVDRSEDVLRLAKPGKAYEIERQVEQQLEYTRRYYEQSGHEQDHAEAEAERSEQVDKAMSDWLAEAEWEDLGPDWLLQEIVPGEYEYSTTVLMDHGTIVDYACSRYKFSRDVYVWPALEYSKSDHVSVPEHHLGTMQLLLTNFTGIGNVNYKIRPDGRMCIFEVNPRVGGDLVWDVPKPRVRAMFEKLDAMFS